MTSLNQSQSAAVTEAVNSMARAASCPLSTTEQQVLESDIASMFFGDVDAARAAKDIGSENNVEHAFVCCYVLEIRIGGLQNLRAYLDTLMAGARRRGEV